MTIASEHWSFLLPEERELATMSSYCHSAYSGDAVVCGILNALTEVLAKLGATRWELDNYIDLTLLDHPRKKWYEPSAQELLVLGQRLVPVSRDPDSDDLYYREPVTAPFTIHTPALIGPLLQRADGLVEHARYKMHQEKRVSDDWFMPFLGAVLWTMPHYMREDPQITAYEIRCDTAKEMRRAKKTFYVADVILYREDRTSSTFHLP